MKKQCLLSLVLLLITVFNAGAQQTEMKNYPAYYKAGEVYLLYSWGEYNTSTSTRNFTVDVPRSKNYYLSVLANRIKGAGSKVYIDDVGVDYIYAQVDGWQYLKIDFPIPLTSGKHKVTFSNDNAMVPMFEEFLTAEPISHREAAPVPVKNFLAQQEILRQQPVITMPTDTEIGELTSKVLPNPLGQYDHAIDTTFSYSHFSWVYLTAGVHTLATASSTASRTLTVFNTGTPFYSWSNVNGGPNGESYLNLGYVPAGYYAVMLRTVNGATGLTNILLDNSTIVTGATIGGRSYLMSANKGGPLNFFTCRLTTGDTRMIVSKSLASSARGYNDDYAGTGDWSWGLASRIKKDFGTDSVRYGFVCAYSPTSNGISDVYLGNLNSEVNNTNYPEFPLLKPDDAIRAAPNTGIYNCISWSGGVTTTWIWPPSSYSTYSCTSSGTDVTCFDNFYSNNPVRYPGAWNYTRTGATAANATVDLWALNAYYTHASVRKPGNNHPHGYDWESKPGGTARTFHPRNALTNNSFGYGSVVNYYKSTGTYARGAATELSFESDADAVRAGVAIVDVAKLTGTANEKLNTLLRKVDMGFDSRFNELYEAWKKTWEANVVYSDPAAYCKNAEFAAMAAYAQKNPKQAMLLVFDKFVNGNDHPVGELLLTLTKEKYGYLLEEVKTERLAKPNDEAGRYRIHGDHDNGVLYVEKILRLLELTADQPLAADNINVIVSPNPVKDRLTVQVTTTRTARVSVVAIAGQTGRKQVMQPESDLPAGTHRFQLNIQGFAGNSGDIIAVQVMVDGQLKTVKVLVAK
jgi:hypothetical protein